MFACFNVGMRFIILSVVCVFFTSLDCNASSCLSGLTSKPICPSSEWKLRKDIDDINYEPAVWSRLNGKDKSNFLMAKMKRVKFKNLKELRITAISEFSNKKFHWKKEFLSKKDIVVAEVISPDKKHKFFQGYIRAKNGDFFNLNCMSTQKIAEWKSCAPMFELVSRRL